MRTSSQSTTQTPPLSPSPRSDSSGNNFQKRRGQQSLPLLPPLPLHHWRGVRTHCTSRSAPGATRLECPQSPGRLRISAAVPFNGCSLVHGPRRLDRVGRVCSKWPAALVRSLAFEGSAFRGQACMSEPACQVPTPRNDQITPQAGKACRSSREKA